MFDSFLPYFIVGIWTISVVCLMILFLLKRRVRIKLESIDQDFFDEESTNEFDYLHDKALDIQEEIFAEWSSASKKFGPFNSSHEGFAVLHEEFDELKAEVWKNVAKHPDRDANMRKEAIQVAAMALRFLTDCCKEPDQL